MNILTTGPVKAIFQFHLSSVINAFYYTTVSFIQFQIINQNTDIKMWRIIVLLFVSNAFTPTTTLPQGAPESVCDTMLPFHGGGIRPMTTVSPFSIVPTASAVGQGQILTIEIRSVPPELRFGGFMLHARSTSPPYKVVSVLYRTEHFIHLINVDI